ncbi:type I restriction endonuclease, partial [Clostridium perfringens]|uniref:type I restriction endonuclease n=1 Tax=Clostridium perfringens TaxID=1502 RepID=UPI001FB0DB0D
MSIKFNEEKLENAIIELFKQSDYSYIKGEELNRENTEVLIKDDLKKFLLKKYKDEEITEYETDSIIRSLEILPSSSLYDSNKKIMNMISEGFTIKREDSTKKDLFIQLIDYENIDNNIFKIVNQMVIKEY